MSENGNSLPRPKQDSGHCRLSPTWAHHVSYCYCWVCETETRVSERLPAPAVLCLDCWTRSWADPCFSAAHDVSSASPKTCDSPVRQKAPHPHQARVPVPPRPYLV